MGCLQAPSNQMETRSQPLQGSVYSYRISTTSKDWQGLKKDTFDFLYLELIGLTVLYFMPEGFSNWGEEEKSRKELVSDKWWNNVQHLNWDKDDWYINYVLHPYWGAAYYVRARHRGYDRNSSVWFSATLSTLFEFGGEAIFEEPSIQDLITTPLGALLFGEYLYTWRLNTLTQYHTTDQIPLHDKILLILSDPLGAFYYKKDELFNAITDFEMRPFYAAMSPINATNKQREWGFENTSAVIGLHVKFRW